MGFFSSVVKGIGGAITGGLSGGPIGAVAGGIGGFMSGQDSDNVSSAQDALNSQQQKNFETNLAWQKEMATTAHQKEVEDLKKAGLNPILSAGGRGATASGGSSLPQLSNSAAAANEAGNRTFQNITASASGLMQADAAQSQADAAQANARARSMEVIEALIPKSRAEVQQMQANIKLIIEKLRSEGFIQRLHSASTDAQRAAAFQHMMAGNLLTAQQQTELVRALQLQEELVPMRENSEVWQTNLLGIPGLSMGNLFSMLKSLNPLQGVLSK